MSELIERFEPVPRYEGVYLVSNYGYVISIRTGKKLCLDRNRSRYLRVTLSKNGKTKRYLIHRLVLRVFKPEKGWTLLEGGHIDGDKKNNREDNLEWQTKSENHKHRHNTLGKNNFKGGWKPIATNVNFDK